MFTSPLLVSSQVIDLDDWRRHTEYLEEWILNVAIR